MSGIQNVQDIKGIIRRRIKVFLLTSIPLAVIAGIVIYTLPPIYVSKATIIVEAQRIPEEYVKTTVTSYVEERLHLITQRILSRDNLLDIIKQFKLYPGMMGEYPTEIILAKMRKNIIFETITTRDLVRRTGRPTTVAFSLSFEGKDPETVQKVANVLASLYLEENFKKREEQATSTTIFLQQELDRLKEQINEYANKISIFKQAHMGELPEHSSIILQALDRLNRDLDQATMQIRSLQERKIYLEGQIASLPSIGTVAAGAGEPSLSPRERLAALKAELTQLQSRLSERHPDIKRLKREIQETEAYVAQADKNVVDVTSQQSDNPAYISLKTQLDTTELEIKNLMQQREKIKKEIKNYQDKYENIPLVEREYNNLTQDYTNAQRKYNDIMDKLMEAKVARGMEETQFGERFTILEPAQVPGAPEKPDRKKLLLLGLFLSLGIGAGLAFLQETLDHSIKTVQELKKLSKIPVLSAIPFIETEAEKRHNRNKFIFRVLILFLAITISALLIHYFVIPFDTLWFKLKNKIIIKL